MTIKTFRGLIADGAVDTVVLHTNDGSTGYRIVNLAIVSSAPGTALSENVIKIYKTPQTSVDALVNMSDNTLLGCAIYHETAGVYGLHTIFFENEIFNQDIYITNSDAGATASSCNYYLELEQITLDLNENTVATLKDIRNIQQPAV